MFSPESSPPWPPLSPSATGGGRWVVVSSSVSNDCYSIVCLVARCLSENRNIQSIVNIDVKYIHTLEYTHVGIYIFTLAKVHPHHVQGHAFEM